MASRKIGSTYGSNGPNGNATTLSSNKHPYNPDDFQIPARDHQGHSVRLWCNVQPTVDHEINAVMGSKKWPFKVKGDFVRWCVWEGVKRIQKMEPVPGSMIVIAETIMESCKAANQWLKFKSSVDATEETVKHLMDSGNEEEALKLLSNLRTHVLQLDESSWRDQWMGEFEKRFSHIWARARQNPVSLSAAAASE